LGKHSHREDGLVKKITLRLARVFSNGFFYTLVNRRLRMEEIDYLSLPPPEERLGTRHSGFGIVKWYKDEKGYGCISCEATKPWDIWCHFSAIEGTGFRSLQQGQRVRVNYVRADQDSFRYVATRVRAAE